MQKKFKSIKEVADELRKRGELDEGKYQTFIEYQKHHVRKWLIACLITYTICITIFFFPVELAGKLALLGLVTTLLLGLRYSTRKEYIRLFNLYNIGIKTDATVDKIHKNLKHRGGVASFIYYSFTDKIGKKYSVNETKVEAAPSSGTVNELISPKTRRYAVIQANDALPILYIDGHAAKTHWIYSEKENAIFNVHN